MLWLLFCSDTTKLAPLALERAVFNCAAGSSPASSMDLAKSFCRENKLGTKGVPYKLLQLAANGDNHPLLVAKQFSVSNLDPAAVVAGQTAPVGKVHRERATGHVGLGGFQEIGDRDLPVGGEGGMFEEFHDGTFSDLVQDRNGAQEAPRDANLPPGYEYIE